MSSRKQGNCWTAMYIITSNASCLLGEKTMRTSLLREIQREESQSTRMCIPVAKWDIDMAQLHIKYAQASPSVFTPLQIGMCAHYPRYIGYGLIQAGVWWSFSMGTGISAISTPFNREHLCVGKTFLRSTTCSEMSNINSSKKWRSIVVLAGPLMNCDWTRHLQGWQMDSPATGQPTTFRLAKPREGFGGALPIPPPFADELSKPGQIRVRSSEELHTQPGSSISASLHRLHKHNPFARHDLGFDVEKSRQNLKYTNDWHWQKTKAHAKTSEMECCIVPNCWLRKLRHGNHCEEVLCENRLQKLGCTTLRHPKVECRIVRESFLRKLQHSHHCEVVLSENCPQKLGCMTNLHPKVECCIVPNYWLRKLQHCHHCEEGLCEHHLQKLGCMTVLYPKEECCTVPNCCLRKLRHGHHCEEELCEHHLQKFGCMTLCHPKVECRIVPDCWLRKLRHCHHCEEVLCEFCLQKFGCMTSLHAQLECCTVPDYFFRTLQHFHHCEEGLCDHRRQTSGCMTLLHPKVECCIVPHRSFRKLQRCHHCEVVLCAEHVLQKPLLGALCLGEKVAS